MKKQYKIYLGIIAAVLLLATLLIQGTKKIEITTEQVGYGTMTDSFRENGLIDSPEDFLIYVPYDAKIQSICSKGDSVKKGDALFTMDNSELNLQKQQLQAQIQALQGQRSMNAPNITQHQMDMAELAIASAKTSFSDAEKNLQRIKALYGLEGASLVELENAQTLYDNAVQNLELKKKQLAELQEQKKERAGTGEYYHAQITALQVRLDDVNQKLEKTVVTSPIDGIIKSVDAKAGAYAQATQSVLEIAADDHLLAICEVLTENVPALKIGQDVEVVQKTYAGDVIHHASIIHIDEFAQPKISSLGLDEQRVEVKVKLHKNDKKLRDGYDVDIIFKRFERDHIFYISKTSYFEEDGKFFVWKVKGNKIKKTEIVPGYIGDYQVEVLEGLEENDVIATDPNNSSFQDGLRVKYEK